MDKLDDYHLARFFDALKIFGIGFSWGGFESLAMPCLSDNLLRSAHKESVEKLSIIRLHIGLENVDDLIEDLKNAFSMIYV